MILSGDFGTHWKRTVKTEEETENWSRTLKRRAGNFNLLWWQQGNNYNQKDHEIQSLSYFLLVNLHVGQKEAVLNILQTIRYNYLHVKFAKFENLQYLKLAKITFYITIRM